MISLRSFGRNLVNRATIQAQSRRTLYPFYMRYMVKRVRPDPLSKQEEFFIFLLFCLGFMGPPSYICYDVNKKMREHVYSKQE
ncbi:V-type proton ATPase subunit E [Sarcoptes scabiei]|uniref:Uncharacterized protein n=1 Tax=Sarcoptes scabiei TaxID=52283 RepID=A0A132AJM6_SARSC|nr:hypothetical protein QR98_0097390 [Sarcoptes scabiei]UXI16184.1 V-type proton ATPase subunit E [Sarcoptes scabiei]